MNVLGILFNMYAVMYVYLLKKKKDLFWKPLAEMGKNTKVDITKYVLQLFTLIYYRL